MVLMAREIPLSGIYAFCIGRRLLATIRVMYFFIIRRKKRSGGLAQPEGVVKTMGIFNLKRQVQVLTRMGLMRSRR